MDGSSLFIGYISLCIVFDVFPNGEVVALERDPKCGSPNPDINRPRRRLLYHGYREKRPVSSYRTSSSLGGRLSPPGLQVFDGLEDRTVRPRKEIANLRLDTLNKNLLSTFI